MIVIAESGLFGWRFYFDRKDVDEYAERDGPAGQRLQGEAEWGMVDFVHAARIFYNA